MTNRPTDDFDELADDQAGMNNPDEEQAAFGEQSPEGDMAGDVADDLNDTPQEDYLSDDYVAAGVGESAPAATPRDQADDRAFVEDDMADIAEELAEEPATNYGAEEQETEEEYQEEGYDEADPLADDAYDDETAYGDEDGVQYEILEGDEGQPTARGGKDDGKRYFGKYKKNDLIFYGALGGGGLLALIIALVSVMGADEPPSRRPLTTVQQSADSGQQQGQTAQVSGMIVPNNNDIPKAQDLPASSEPMPDGIGVAGAISTLRDEEPLPPPPAMLQPGDIPADPIPADDTLRPLHDVAPQQQPQQPIAAAPTEVAPVASAPTPVAPEPIPAAALPDEPLAPVAQVTAPPQLGVDNTALSDRMSELSIKVTQLNAQLAQVTDNLTNLQKTADKLDKQNQELTGKAGELSARVEDQNKKLEDANKEREELAKLAKQAAAANNAGSLDELKISLAQLERRVATLGKGSGAAAPAAQAAPRSFDGPPAPKPTPIQRAPRDDTGATAPAPVPSTTTAANPRSPKSRDQAGLLYSAPKPQWVLRGATSTMAWLSPRSGSAELRRVAPGDTLEGLGQIIEIKQEGSRWAVIGTEGVVR